MVIATDNTDSLACRPWKSIIYLKSSQAFQSSQAFDAAIWRPMNERQSHCAGPTTSPTRLKSCLHLLHMSTVGMAFSRHELPRYNFHDIGNLERAPDGPSKHRERYVEGPCRPRLYIGKSSPSSMSVVIKRLVALGSNERTALGSRIR
jgi:hypothetical protein